MTDMQSSQAFLPWFIKVDGEFVVVFFLVIRPGRGRCARGGEGGNIEDHEGLEDCADFAESCETGFVQDSGAEVVVEVVTKVLEVSAGVNMSKLRTYRGRSEHVLQLLLARIEELAVQIEFIHTQLFEITTPRSRLIE
jgi:hypothetical protein